MYQFTIGASVVKNEIIMTDFVTYDIAVKLKEKGFKEQCLAYYTKDSNFYYNTSYGSDVENAFKPFNSRPNHICRKRIDAPTISQVLKWLREEKGLYVDISLYKKGYCTLIYETNFPDDKDYANSWRVNNTYNTYEEAAIVGIKYVVDNLI